MVKNKGYTLIELIIVIAIIGILAGASFVSIGVIREAKRQAAVNTLNSQISSLLVRTKAVSAASKNAAVNPTDDPLCMVIKKRTDGTYAIVTGTYDGSGSMSVSDPNVDANCEAILPKDIVQIKYVPDGAQRATVVSSSDDDDLLIQFVKSDGSTQYGGGEYEVYVKGGRLYATIYLNKVSGNHYIK